MLLSLKCPTNFTMNFYSYIITHKSTDVIYHSSAISTAGNLKDLKIAIVTKVPFISEKYRSIINSINQLIKFSKV